jgi:hypothetical protein
LGGRVTEFDGIVEVVRVDGFGGGVEGRVGV